MDEDTIKRIERARGRADATAWLVMGCVGALVILLALEWMGV